MLIVPNGDPQLIILLYATGNTCHQINRLNLVICYCNFMYINNSDEHLLDQIKNVSVSNGTYSAMPSE